MISNEIQRILAATRVSRNFEHLLGAAKPARELAKLMQGSGFREIARSLSASARLHHEMQALIEPLRMSSATLRMISPARRTASCAVFSSVWYFISPPFDLS